MNHAISQAASVSSKIAYTSSGGLVILGYLNIHEFGIFCGIGIGVISLFVNLFYRRRHDRRAAVANQKFVKWIEKNIEDGTPPPDTIPPYRDFYD